jgi:TatD DNase family protein
MIFDSHAHYDDKAFNEDREEIIEKIKEAGVTKVVNCAGNLESCLKTLEFVNNYDIFYGAIGIHPQSAGEVNGNINKIGDMLNNKKIVAVGEIGLDYYWEGYDRELQIKAFKEQMDLARSLNLPVVIHDREAHEDTLKVIKEFKGVRGVIHCYSGSLEFAKEVLKLDYYLGFTGVITFKNAKKSVEVVEAMPIDRLLVETDCPYLAPVPHRGERNDSSYLVHIINKIAEIRGLSYEEVRDTTYNNACKLFNISTT